MRIFIILIFLISISTYASFSAQFTQADLIDTLQMLAATLNRNIIISPSVQGKANLSVTNSNPSDALNLLLMSHDLMQIRVGNIWYVAPRAEILAQKKQAAEWRDTVDASLPLITKTYAINYANAQQLAEVLQSSLLSKRAKISVDTRTNSLCIQENALQLQKISAVIAKLDVRVPQISIAARIVSVDADFEKELGIYFGVQPFHAKPLSPKEPNSLQNLLGSYSLGIVKLADSSLLDVKLSALESRGHAELISSPSLFTANQQTASIEAGEEVPYQETTKEGGTAIVFKKAVLGLKVTPQVLPGSNVLLQLQINQDRPSNKIVGGMPTISTRQIITNVFVKSGQTIVLGGIYETNREQGILGFPFLNQIPVLGLITKQTKTRANKRELLIFVTPTVMTH